MQMQIQVQIQMQIQIATLDTRPTILLYYRFKLGNYRYKKKNEKNIRPRGGAGVA